MRAARYFAAFLLAIATFLVPEKSSAQISVGVSIHIGPPALPVYVQPPCPAAGYIWTPGYWGYGEQGYYWVPGTWIVAPQPGLLWTPGYWGFAGGIYAWHGGYWGPHVGFYGGVNYGFGYGGVGFEGGRWEHGGFAYNRTVTNVNVTVVHNTYEKTVVVNNTTVNHASFNGEGGVKAEPTAAERTAEREHHVQATSSQLDHQRQAGTNRSQLASVNGGKPSIAASPKPGVFSGKGVVEAKAAGGPVNSANRTTTNGAVKTDRPPSATGARANAATTAKTNTSRNSASDRPPSSSARASQATGSAPGANSNQPATSTSKANKPANLSKPVPTGKPPSTINRPPSSSYPNTSPAKSGRKPAEHAKQPR